jgi:predicted amidohydrolase
MRFEGKLFNCGVVIYQGRVLGLVPKTYLPNYREFYEKRQFTSGRQAISREVLFLGERVCQSPKFHPVPGCLTLVLCNLARRYCWRIANLLHWLIYWTLAKISR